MIDYLGNSDVIVKCDDCDKKVRVSAVESEHLIDGKYSWHPRWFYNRPPTPEEIDYIARRHGIQFFRRGRAKRTHFIEGRCRHLCDTCRMRRRGAYRDKRANMTWYDKIKERFERFFS